VTARSTRTMLMELVCYRETLALELPAVLFPFLDHLTLTSDGTSRPLFTPGGLANETYALLESQLGLLGAAGTPERESLRIALGLRETVGGIEGMRRVWQEEAQVDSQEECENWVRLGKEKVCTVDQFWDVVGREQEATNDVLSWPASELYVFKSLGVDTVLMLCIIDHSRHSPSITSRLLPSTLPSPARSSTPLPPLDRPSPHYSSSSATSQTAHPRPHDSSSSCDGNPTRRALERTSAWYSADSERVSISRRVNT
jgi:hypothetical protein